MERIFSFRNPWFLASVGGVAALAVIAALIGFIWLPSAQNDRSVNSLWDAICGAAGVPRAWFPARPAPGPAQAPSEVVVNAQMMTGLDSQAVGRGATLSQNCTMCHGARGISQADTPNLAGQHASSIYKQLRDFQTGHRKSAIMQPLVTGLSDRDMRDLAAYYAYLPRPRNVAAGGDIPVIVKNGSPMRNIPPCIACHGGIDSTPATPVLDGESETYIRTQLRAFASGARSNDLHQQMRNVARSMTAEEIDAAARYYASR
jgi:cytochrome c553